ncbi:MULTISPECIES: Na(+)/H(+) antiporter subunit F1 [Exiguobacterium]|jgi:multicomponent Na+:H+ antiporter subunit F|uniref:Na(+)/H(+) antiporter subunit F1 n=3 Tax=Exiguobacterium TaxID=33986 RepID=A0ABY7X5E4_9BACL|nr:MULTISPECIES: Na(+)/H(+) antiporter subunit F1 [Exiguobacterium]MCC9623314.1 Na(+)/H(+) antiporter subunit F1 [Thalassospira sp. MA62]QPI66911.1 Na(+)/H(+) antiporter subunit F1 [Exiguobacterium sp. PBE]MBG0916437.1 Na(+)/H(+) antiporter subunit F1 [Exiguobacterium sp. SRB7LM]MBQ6458130.1 Na(+)/H(+) antiporter subunit F1 [Exiguobacterium sp.]MCA0979668.1 Na(+)/H(+) antiporter subunit F1 [Exiguobacterium aestuarii]
MDLLDILIYISLAILLLAMLMMLYRVVKGPTTADRVIALDSIGIALISVVALLSILLDTTLYFEVILLLSILAFIGTVAFSKFLERGEIIQHDRDNDL